MLIQTNREKKLIFFGKQKTLNFTMWKSNKCTSFEGGNISNRKINNF